MKQAIQFLRDYCPAAPMGMYDYFEDSFVEIDIGKGYHVTPKGIYIGICENDVHQLVHEMAHFLEMEDLSRLLEPDFGLGSKNRRAMIKAISYRERENRVEIIAKELLQSWGLSFEMDTIRIHTYYDVQQNQKLLTEWKRRNNFLRRNDKYKNIPIEGTPVEYIM